jgi:hypothetical protein
VHDLRRPIPFANRSLHAPPDRSRLAAR